MAKNDKYNYVPNVNLFMEQSGYKMNLFDILNEPIKKKSNTILAASRESNQPIEILYYTPSDINGKNWYF